MTNTRAQSSLFKSRCQAPPRIGRCVLRGFVVGGGRHHATVLRGRLTQPAAAQSANASGSVTSGSGDVSHHVNRAATTVLPTWMTVKPADSRESPFAELDLMELWDGVGKTRVRQHVNPLRREFQQPASPPDWAAVYDDPSLPLALDIGSGYGRFLLLLQRNNPQQRVNYLGLEIRRTLVDRSNEWVKRLGLQGGVHYLFANATVSLASLLAGYPGPITDVFIQFPTREYPDPHFKRRHHKRRVVQPQLVAALREIMAPGGRLLLQSDVEETCVAMRNMFERYGGDAFTLAPQHSECAVFFSRPTGSSAPPTSLEPHADAAAAAPLTSSAAAAAAEVVAAHNGGTTAVGGPSEGDVGGRQQGGVASARHTAAEAEDVRHAADGGGAAVPAAAAVAAARTASDASTDEDVGVSGSDGTDEESGDTDADEEYDIDSMVSEWAKGGWLVDNPIGTPTEREHYVGQQGLPVYRVLLVRR